MSGTLVTLDHEAFLAGVELELEGALASHPGIVADAAALPMCFGGKRLRPLLVLVGLPADVPVPSAAIGAAASVELVHTASLLHDDLLDHAELRRGQVAVHRSHGSSASIGAGDLLFSRAFWILATVTDLSTARRRQAIATLAEAAHALAIGEARQAEQIRDIDLSVDAYLDRCMLKTGTLFGAALVLGAIIGGGGPDDVSLLHRYGTSIGAAFQLVDDALDCSGDERALGKRPGADLRDGTMTLPLLLAARDDLRVREALRDERPNVDTTLALVAATGAVDATIDRARSMAEEAIAMLDDLSARFDRESLAEIARRSIERTT